MTLVQPTRSSARGSLRVSDATGVARRLGTARFELADAHDDEELRELLRDTPMSGRVRLLFLREPSYLRAARIQGEEVQVVVARVKERIGGVFTRALRPTWINGERVTAGYLSDLRIAPSLRGGTTLQRGYRYLRELHADGKAEIYSTVIVEDNRRALATLAAGRAGLPRYTDLGLVCTPMLHLRCALPPLPGDVRRGSADELPAIVAKLNENRLQFAPCYSTQDFLPGGRLSGLRAEDFYVLRRGESIAGVIAVWDQSAFRQTVVHGYGGALAWLRPLVNLVRKPGLPAPGRRLSYSYVALASTDDVEAFSSLLRRACNDALAAGNPRLLVGLHERDPRLSTLDEYSCTRFAGRLFAVTFDEPPELDGRVPYMEAALL